MTVIEQIRQMTIDAINNHDAAEAGGRKAEANRWVHAVNQLAELKREYLREREDGILN